MFGRGGTQGHGQGWFGWEPGSKCCLAGTLVNSTCLGGVGGRILAEVEVGEEKIFDREKEAWASQTNLSLPLAPRKPLRNGLVKDKLF